MTEYGRMYSFLMRPHRIRQDIATLEYRIEGIRQAMLPGAVRYDKDKVQTSPENQMEKGVVEIATLEERIAVLRDELLDATIEVGNAIDLLDDEIERAVLTSYYVERVGPERTAERIGYSERWMYNKKREAVQKLFSEMQCRAMI